MTTVTQRGWLTSGNEDNSRNKRRTPSSESIYENTIPAISSLYPIGISSVQRIWWNVVRLAESKCDLDQGSKGDWFNNLVATGWAIHGVIPTDAVTMSRLRVFCSLSAAKRKRAERPTVANVGVERKAQPCSSQGQIHHAAKTRSHSDYDAVEISGNRTAWNRRDNPRQHSENKETIGPLRCPLERHMEGHGSTTWKGSAIKISGHKF